MKDSKEACQKVFLNAKIWTGNKEDPFAEAMATCGDRILTVGSNRDVLAMTRKDAAINDLSGMLVLPGFIDSHLHFMEGGFYLSSVQLKDAATREEFINRLREYASSVKKGEWILGGGWDNENWGGELPSREWIDGFTGNIPVLIKRSDIHTALANTAALRLAGIEYEAKEVAGGELVRFPDGRLTGILRDNAIKLVESHITSYSNEKKIMALKAAMAHVASNGITSVHHMGTIEDFWFFKKARDEGILRTRIYSTAPLQEYADIVEIKSDSANSDEWLKINGAKLFSDGSLGSKTAAFTEPYTDAPDKKGLLIEEPMVMQKGIIAADNAGLQVVVHAIGDRANNVILNCYEKAIERNGKRDRRLRIEHAQHLLDEDTGRFGRSGIIASMQPWHLMDDGRWAENSLGIKRARNAYCFRSLIDSGARLAFGSDWPVAPANPILGIYAAVTRHTLGGNHPDGWNQKEKISREEAIRAYTIDAAYASFEEDIKGSLEQGKLADFILLDKDLLSIDTDDIKKVQVLQTYVGGKQVYNRK